MLPRIAPPLTLGEIYASLCPSSDEIELFENEFAEWAGVPHAKSFAYARTAIREVLTALNARGREVLIPAYTCAAVPQAVIAAGAVPRLVDINPTDFQMNVDSLHRARTPNTCAVILTFLYGIAPQNMAALMKATEGLKVILDLALAPGLIIEGRPATHFGCASIFSLNYGKMFHCLRGGMLCTDSVEIVAHLADGIPKSSKGGTKGGLKWIAYACAGYLALNKKGYRILDFLERKTRFLSPIDPLDTRLPRDADSALHPAQAAIGRIQLRQADKIISKHQRHAGLYFSHLRKTRALPPARPGSVWSHFPVRVCDIQKARRFFRSRGISVGAPWYYSLADLPTWKHFSDVPCPEATRAAREVLCLPTLATYNDDDIEYVASVFLEWKKLEKGESL